MTEFRRISAQPLTADAFGPFGDVIEAHGDAEQRRINAGNTVRFHDLAQLTLIAGDGAGDGQPCLSIFRSTPLALPLRLESMERHPLSSQAFFPLDARPYLVVVAPPGVLDEQAIRVFRAAPGQGVNYHPGTWHHFSLALEETSDFLVVDRALPTPASGIAVEDNCDEVTLNTIVEVQP